MTPAGCWFFGWGLLMWASGLVGGCCGGWIWRESQIRRALQIADPVTCRRMGEAIETERLTRRRWWRP